METLRLYRIAEKDKISVDFADLPHTKAFSITVEGKKFIAVDKNVRPESNEERVMLAHELGHLKTDALYSVDAPALYRKKIERRADVWAICHLVPLPSLRRAYKEGCESVSSLAEHFSVTEEFMQKAIKYYTDQKSVV